MIILYPWNSYPLLHTIKLVYRNNHHLDKHMLIKEKRLFYQIIIYSQSNLYSNYNNLGGYMLVKTLVVYYMCSLLTYIFCAFFWGVASISVCQIKKYHTLPYHIKEAALISLIQLVDHTKYSRLVIGKHKVADFTCNGDNKLRFLINSIKLKCRLSFCLLCICENVQFSTVFVSVTLNLYIVNLGYNSYV